MSEAAAKGDALLSSVANIGTMSLLDKYEGWLIGENIERSSRKQYLYIAERVVEHMFGAEPSLSVDEMRDVLAHLPKEELNVLKEKICWTSTRVGRVKQNTAGTKSTLLNSFMEFAGNPNRVKIPKKVRVERIPLSPEESEALFKAAGHYRDTVIAVRNQAIVAMLLEGAIRKGSFNPLRSDLMLDDGYFIVRDSKNGDDVPVALADSAIVAIRAYLRVRMPGNDAESDKRLFISRRGTALREGMVYDIVRECGVRAGIERNVFPHLCRHTKLTDLIEQDVNPWWVKDFAGQKHIQSLAPYIHSGKQKKQREKIRSIPLLHPREDDPRGDSGNGGGEPTVRIDYGPVAGTGIGSGGTMDRLLQALLDGKIGEATYNRSLDAMIRGEAPLNQQ
jgi:integrase